MLYLSGFEVPQVIDAYHSVRQSKSLFNALPFDISPVNPSQVFRQENRKCITNPQHISKLQLFPSSNLSGWIKRTISDTQGPCAVRRSEQLFLKYLCDARPSLLALTPQGLAPKSGSKPVCRASITPALCLGKGAKWPLRRNAGA